MKKSEMVKILAMISFYYPKAKSPEEDENNNVDAMAAAWLEFFEPFTFEQVAAALKRHITNSTYEPRIADLLTELKVMQPTETKSQNTPEQAWALVLMAVKNSTYHSRREFEKLPADIKRRVGSAEVLQYWATVDDDGATLSVARANFLKNYGEDLKGHKMDDFMPASVKRLIQTAEPVPQLEAQTITEDVDETKIPMPPSKEEGDEEKANAFFELAKKIKENSKRKE